MSQAMEHNSTNANVNFVISALSSITVWIASHEIDILFRLLGSTISIVTGILAIRGYLREDKKRKKS